MTDMKLLIILGLAPPSQIHLSTSSHIDSTLPNMNNGEVSESPVDPLNECAPEPTAVQPEAVPTDEPRKDSLDPSGSNGSRRQEKTASSPAETAVIVSAVNTDGGTTSQYSPPSVRLHDKCSVNVHVLKCVHFS